MASLAQDNFDRANTNTLGANWTTQTGETSNFGITSNQAQSLGDNVDGAVNYSAATWPNDQYSQAKCTATAGYTTGDGPGVGLRMSTSAQTYYRCVVNRNATNTVQLSKKISGAYTAIANRNTTYAAGTLLYAEVQSTTFVIKYGGVQLGASITDASIASGRAGLVYSGENSGQVGQWDDWEGGDFTGGGGATVRRYSLSLTGVG